MEFNFNISKDENIRQNFYNKILISLKNFCKKYGLDASEIKEDDPIISIEIVSKQVADRKGNLIIIVDGKKFL